MKIVSETHKPKQSWGVIQHDMSGEFLTGYVGNSGHRHTEKLGVNVVIEDALTIGDVVRGDSAAGAKCQGDVQEYYISVGNLAKIIQALCDGRMVIGQGGKVVGRWTFVKQGSTISLTPAPRA